MKEVADLLEKTKSSYTVSDFVFKPKNLKSKATPAAVRILSTELVKPAKKSPAKSPARSPAKKAAKRTNSTERQGRPKKVKAEAEEEDKNIKERKKRSPTKNAALQKKKGKEPRQVRKPPPGESECEGKQTAEIPEIACQNQFPAKGNGGQ